MRIPFKISLLQSIIIIWSILTILIYTSAYIPPQRLWIAGLISHLIPIILIFNTGLFFILILFRKRSSLIPFILLLIGWPYISRSFAFAINHHEPADMTLLSYNVKLFRKPGVYDKFSTELIRWVADDKSEVKCLQEYSSNSNWEVLDATSQIKAKGYYSYIFKADVIDNDHNPGIAIFSKYKIINTGIVFQDKHTVNAAIFADIELNNKTIRIYNVHLASMNLELENSIENRRVFRTIRKLKSGAIKRNEQVELLLTHLKNSPFPVIVSGDFNETPYSYVYNILSDSLHNSFNEAGNGLGFTLNDFPYLLRIDHQFHSEGIRATRYKVDHKMKISDHFPTYGLYRLEN